MLIWVAVKVSIARDVWTPGKMSALIRERSFARISRADAVGERKSLINRAPTGCVLPFSQGTLTRAIGCHLLLEYFDTD